MIPLRSARPPIGVALAVLATFSWHCKKSSLELPKGHRVEPIGLIVPMVEGWQPDPTIEATPMSRGGLLMRLVPSGGVPGAPRIDVRVEAPKAQKTNVESFMTQNLREMADMEKANRIWITHVEQRPIHVGPRRAYRVHHEYLMKPADIAITQQSVFLVLDGRGVAITAAGRAELFAPQAAAIDSMLEGLVTVPPLAKVKTTPSPGKTSTVQPIDATGSRP